MTDEHRRPDGPTLELHFDHLLATDYIRVVSQLEKGGAQAPADPELPVSPEPLRVVVVEDEPLTRGLLASLLQTAGYQVQVAADTRTALAAVREFHPHLLLVDLGLGSGPGGIEVLLWAEQETPETALVVLTNYPTPAMAGIDAGLIPERATYLNKRSMMDGPILIRALEWAVAQMPPIRYDRFGDNPLADLSQDQLDVLRLVAQGLSNAEIAANRGTSVHAVETLFHRTLLTLGVPRDKARNSRVLAARIYFELGGTRQ